MPSPPPTSGQSSPAHSVTPRKETKGQLPPASRGLIEIHDEVLDELANDIIPLSSPYFTQPTQLVGRTTQPTQLVNWTTQPTQIVNRTTQPTQILNQTTLQTPSSPFAPESPSTGVVEVPASSPFQPKAQPRPTSNTSKRPTAVGRVGSLMAPAGTSFRSPVGPRPNVPKSTSRTYIDISDDDVNEDYKRRDSSGDEAPMRGDIRPSSFVKKTHIAVPTSKAPIESTLTEMKDIEFSQIHDLRLRHLTKDVFKVVSKAKPSITRRECRDALTKGPGWQVAFAVNKLLGGKPGTNSSSIRDTANPPVNGSFTSSAHPSLSQKLDKYLFKGNAGNSKIPSSNNHSTHRSSAHNPQESAAGKLSKTASSNLESVSNSKDSRGASSSATMSKLPSRRRLVQGRRRRTRSPSPTPVFSVPSSASSTRTVDSTPGSSQSRDSKSHVLVDSSPEPDPIPAKTTRRRLKRGRRSPSPVAPTNVITLDSDSDSDLPSAAVLFDSRKRKAEEPSERESASHSAKRLNTRVNEQETRSAQVARPKNRKHKVSEDSEPDNDSGAAFESGNGRSLNESSDDLMEVDASTESDKVLDYLNTCTAETLAQITSHPIANTRLMLKHRPFASIATAKRVVKTETSNKKVKRKQKDVGDQIVSVLTDWFDAFNLASSVIKTCEIRGDNVKSIMSTWSMDKNGVVQSGMELPISKKPVLMADDLTLKSYQLFGLNWMALMHSEGYSGVLADDMGLGKTCQVISMIAHIVETYDEASDDSRPWPNLIVVPPSTVENWENEFRRFAPDIDVCIYEGKSRRSVTLEEAQESHVILTTYSSLERDRQDISFINATGIHAAIFDEGHKLKNPMTLLYKQLTRLYSQWRLVLSGTPIQNNLKELLALLHFVEPELFDSDTFEKLSTIFTTKVPNKEVHNFAALAKERVTNARSIMAPFILQRRKDIVLTLPEKVENNVIVGMHPRQKAIYDEIKNRYLRPKGSKTDSTIQESNPWIQLKKAAIHPQLFRVHFTDQMLEKMVDILWKKCSAAELSVASKEDRFRTMTLNHYKGMSDFDLHLECTNEQYFRYIGHFDVPKFSWEEAPKVQKLLELIREWKKTGERCLVFSKFELVINILRETFTYAGIKYCDLTGERKIDERFPEIQRFNENDDIPVMILTTGAGGTGLNLTAANKVVIFDQSDNPQDDQQASNRAHRIGQTREVEVIRLITKSTIEGLIYNSCVKKLMLAACVEGVYEVEDDSSTKNESVEQMCRKMMLIEDEESSQVDKD
ncbi:SNF2 family N-terminal domain-containing protein [Xylariaceae sp. FL0016]|nr:SNF2 family N-terminal domain-containing protein [Xylariaceae sp. FL0016]